MRALRDLVSRDARAMRPRDDDGLDEFAGRPILFAVGDEEVLERDLAALAPAPEHDAGAERDQQRRRLADRRAVGDVAADRARVANLPAADAQQVVFGLRQVRPERRAGIRNR